jgi:hypothetical protein
MNLLGVDCHVESLLYFILLWIFNNSKFIVWKINFIISISSNTSINNNRLKIEWIKIINRFFFLKQITRRFRISFF